MNKWFIKFSTIFIIPKMCLALGLGQMQVHSYLNQPFSAEIELIDAKNVSLSDIKASVADVEEFNKASLDRAYLLDKFNFKLVRRDDNTLIAISTTEPVIEPYIDLLIDLSSTHGQSFRAYTILLDPPAYQFGKKVNDDNIKVKTPILATEKIEEVKKPIVSDNEAKKYGPTTQDESIWQIAQQFKSDDASIVQVILSIVGTNPTAFQDGNLNGLKTGSVLTIPASNLAKTINYGDAKNEIYQHDLAWKDKKPIQHVIKPPYVDSSNDAQILNSIIAPIPTFEPSMPMIGHEQTLAPAETVTSKTSALDDNEKAQIRAEISIASSALDAISRSNAVLIDQIGKLQAENQRLNDELKQSLEQIKQLEKNKKVVVTRQALKSPVAAGETYEPEGTSSWLWYLLPILLLGGGYWYINKNKTKKVSINQEPEPVKEVEPIKEQEIVKEAEPVMELEPVKESEPIEEPEPDTESEPIKEPEPDPESGTIKEPETLEEPEPREPINEDVIIEPITESEESNEYNHEIQGSEASEEKSHHNPVEFKLVTPTAEDEVEPISMVAEGDNTIDFIPSDLKEEEEKLEPPVKSKKALQTLLDLASTYVSMQDYEAAKQALLEVIEFGDEDQKLDAQNLLSQIKE